MTLEQLEQRVAALEKELEQKVAALEKEVVELRREVRPLRSTKTFQESFGMFANDPDFEEVIRLGREYREAQREES